MSSMQRLRLFLILTLASATGLSAQTPGSTGVFGKIYDAQTLEPLIGANVTVLKTYRGAGTNQDGAYEILRLRPGPATLRISYIGYATQDRDIVVPQRGLLQLDVGLQPGAIQLGEIVVTATRQAESTERATSSVSVLSKDAVRQRTALRLDAALESIPGVNLMAENVNIRNSTGYTRGLGSRVLMLMDGVPVLMSDFGNMNWDLLPVTDIERVEVVKGPASAVYGSFALGGVMNIITQSPTPQGRFAIRSVAGLYDRPFHEAWRWTDRALTFNRTDMSYSRQVGRLGMRFSFGRHESTGDRINRHFQRWNTTGKLIFAPTDRSELTLFGSFARDRRGEFVWSRFDHPYLVDPEFEDFRVSQDAWSFYTKYRHRLADWIEVNARISYLRQLSGNQFKVEGDFQPAQGPGANVEAQLSLPAGMRMTMGTEYKYDLAEQRHFGRHFGYTLSPYAQHVWQITDRLKTTVGARYDYHYLLPSAAVQDQFEKLPPIVNPLPDGLKKDAVSPQAGFSYNLFKGTTLHAAYGTGIRIPTIAERFTRFTVPLEFIGNATLKTERSRAFEAGIRQHIGTFAHLEMTAFTNTYENLIEPVYVADLTRFFATLINIERARIRGVEGAFRSSFWNGRLTLNANATWTEPMIQATGTFESIALPFSDGDMLSYRPELIAYLSPALRIGAFTVGADFSYASSLKPEQVQVFKDDPIAPRRVLDVRAAWRYENVELRFLIKNLLHYNYSPIERNLNELRNFALALNWEY